MISQSGPSFSLLHGSWESTTYIQDWKKYLPFQQSCPDPSISIFFYFSLYVYVHKEVWLILRTVLNDSSSLLLRNGFSIKPQSGPLDILCLYPVCSGMFLVFVIRDQVYNGFPAPDISTGSKNLACGPYICSGMQFSPESCYHPLRRLTKIILYVLELFLQ